MIGNDNKIITYYYLSAQRKKYILFCYITLFISSLTQIQVCAVRLRPQTKNKQLMVENENLQATMRQYLDLISRQGGEDLSRAGIEAGKRERMERRESRARVDPGGQFGYEMFRM